MAPADKDKPNKADADAQAEKEARSGDVEEANEIVDEGDPNFKSVGDSVQEAYDMNRQHISNADSYVHDRAATSGREVPGRLGAPDPDQAESAPQTEK